MAIVTTPFSASLRAPLASSPPFLRIAKLAAATCAHRLRCYGGGSSSTAAVQPQPQQRQQEGRNQLRSPDLVALEYADLNLPHKLSEVTTSDGEVGCRLPMIRVPRGKRVLSVAHFCRNWVMSGSGSMSIPSVLPSR